MRKTPVISRCHELPLIFLRRGKMHNSDKWIRLFLTRIQNLPWLFVAQMIIWKVHWAKIMGKMRGLKCGRFSPIWLRKDKMNGKISSHFFRTLCCLCLSPEPVEKKLNVRDSLKIAHPCASTTASKGKKNEPLTITFTNSSVFFTKPWVRTGKDCSKAKSLTLWCWWRKNVNK